MEQAKEVMKKVTPTKPDAPAADNTAKAKEPDYSGWNIFQKMSVITEEIERVGKNLKIKAGSENYKAVAEVDVLDAVKPTERKYGVYSYPVERNIIEAKEIHKTTYEGKPKIDFFMRLETTYRFVNVHNPKDYIDIKTYGDGVDSQDKAPGKAMTYADKYGLLKAYKISTGDDPDQKASETYETSSKTTQKQNPKPTTYPKPTEATQANDEHIGEAVDMDASNLNLLKAKFSGTGLTLRMINEKIEEIFGRQIEVDKLTPKQFSFLTDGIRSDLKKVKTQQTEPTPYDYMDKEKEN